VLALDTAGETKGDKILAIANSFNPASHLSPKSVRSVLSVTGTEPCRAGRCYS
jgi:hypothetical protein